MNACPFHRRHQPQWFISAFALALGMVSGGASGIGLGAASSNSHIGEALRIEIPIQRDASEEISLECIRLAPPRDQANELPWLRQARLSLERDGRLLVLHAPPSNHPALTVSVALDCGLALRREYTLLLEPPRETTQTTAEAPAMTPPSAPPRPTLRPDARPGWETAQSESARSIANALAAGDPANQRALAQAIVAANPQHYGGNKNAQSILPAGSQLIIPPLPATTPAPRPKPREPIAQTSRPPRATPQAPRPQAVSAEPRDRLYISGGAEDLPLRMSLTLGEPGTVPPPDADERLRQEAGMLASLDEKLATQIELTERLRQLETLQSRLQEETSRLAAELKTRGGDIPENAPLTRPQAPPPQLLPTSPHHRTSGLTGCWPCSCCPACCWPRYCGCVSEGPGFPAWRSKPGRYRKRSSNRSPKPISGPTKPVMHRHARRAAPQS